MKKDFYFLYNNIHYLLEFDGIQHFEFQLFYHKTLEYFNYKQNIDILKTYVAVTSGCRIIRIDYEYLKNVYTHIVNALSSNNNIYVSSNELYFFLNQPIAYDVIIKECPQLLSVQVS